MERVKTAYIYTSLIQANLNTINTLTALSDRQKYSFDGYMRYQRAAALADVNQAYANVLGVVGDTSNIRASLKTGDSYRAEAKFSIAPRIPIRVNVTVKNDGGDGAAANINSSIKSAFVKEISNLGFQSGNNGYDLNVSATFWDATAEFANSTYQYCKFSIIYALIDSQTKNEISSDKFTDREGHTTYSGAESRAVAASEKKISDSKEGFGKKLADYLSRL
jgi:hypothetical protein